jgi:hypothetical protein
MYDEPETERVVPPLGLRAVAVALSIPLVWIALNVFGMVLGLWKPTATTTSAEQAIVVAASGSAALSSVAAVPLSWRVSGLGRPATVAFSLHLLTALGCVSPCSRLTEPERAGSGTAPPR